MTADAYFTVPVRSQVPIGLYRRLAAAAEKHGADVGELVVECVRRALVTSAAPSEAPRRFRWTAEHDDLVRVRHAEGVSDFAIAKEIGCANSVVYNHRVALGLPTLFRGRGRLPVTPAESSV
jgi:hypothetical protein